MSNRASCAETKPPLWLPTTMPPIVEPDISALKDEIQKWQRRATILYRQYLLALALAMAVAVVAAFLFSFLAL